MPAVLASLAPVKSEAPAILLETSLAKLVSGVSLYTIQKMGVIVDQTGIMPGVITAILGGLRRSAYGEDSVAPGG